MNYQQKVDAALTELKATGMMQSNYQPPLFKALRKLGLQPRLPHYESPLKIVCSYGAFFGIFWGLFMWFFQWKSSALPVWGALTVAGSAGLLFGLTLSLYYRHGRKKYQLSTWETLGQAATQENQ